MILIISIIMLIIFLFLLELARLLHVRTQLFIDAIVLEEELNGLVAAWIKLIWRVGQLWQRLFLWSAWSKDLRLWNDLLGSLRHLDVLDIGDVWHAHSGIANGRLT